MKNYMRYFFCTLVVLFFTLSGIGQSADKSDWHVARIQADKGKIEQIDIGGPTLIRSAAKNFF